MIVSSHQEPTGRACPRCQRRTDRVSRRWFDRVLSVFMPMVRYRCASEGCGWEGLLMRRHEHQERVTRLDSSYRPQRPDPSRTPSAAKPPRR
ncbi:MAG: hypothetical protein IPF94_00290 [Betaproteobacteria bacterium]|nr:hypothetical protein [Betaproteobacteria bacterium]